MALSYKHVINPVGQIDNHVLREMFEDITLQSAVLTGDQTITGDITIVGNPFTVRSAESTTEIAIDNTATDGDPYLSWQLSGTRKFSFGVDDSDSDYLKLGTTGITTNIALQIPTAGAAVEFADGSNTAPSLSNIGDTNTGIYFDGADNVTIGTGGTGRLSIGTTAISPTLVLTGPDGSASAPAYSFSSTGNEDNGLYLAGANNPAIAAAGAIAMDWSSSTVVVRTGHALNPDGAGAQNFGNATDYWNDISYKTLTDRGCLPWCDEGVELNDGSIVSDLNALSAIQKHPTKKTIHGLPMLDYKTFPKKAYKPADKDGNLLSRDSEGEPIGGADGVEMTMIFGVMIGAFKEIKNRLEFLERSKI